MPRVSTLIETATGIVSMGSALAVLAKAVEMPVPAPPLGVVVPDDDVVAQSIFAQEGGLFAVHVLAHQTDERDDADSRDLRRDLRDPSKGSIEPGVLLHVLVFHDRRAGRAPPVVRRNEVPQKGLLAEVVRSDDVGQADDAPEEIAAAREVDARTFGDCLRHVHHDPDLGMLREELAPNLAWLHHEGTSFPRS